MMDSVGGILATLTVATGSRGFRQLLDWAASFGTVIAFGIEGTYGSGLRSFIRRQRLKMVGVNHPDRWMRKRAGKSDVPDAEHAARAVLAGFAAAVPKTADGAVEMIRQLKVTHDTAVKDRTAAVVTLKAMLIQPPHRVAAVVQFP